MEATEHAHPILAAARRRILKLGVNIVPAILTLRVKPAYGQNVCLSLTMSAATSHGVVTTPGCVPTP